MKKFLTKNWPEIIFATFALLFSFWLMFGTFDYDRKTSAIRIASKLWSDFSATLPLVRSFSWGNNFPPQDPIFAGEPARYHFLFYLLVGILERLGIPLNFALNLPSALGFFGLILMVYFLAKLLFRSRLVAVLSVIFFLFNGSLSFWEFFKEHPLSFQTPLEIMQNTKFPSFGPYDQKVVSAFWNLNIYTNQRHLGASFALVLLGLFFILIPMAKNKKITPRRAFLTGIFLSLLPFFHSVGFTMALIILGGFFLFLGGQRKPILITLITVLIFGIPQLFLMQPGGIKSNLAFRPGYLISDHLALDGLFYYWFMNLGANLFLIPLSFAKASRFARKVFLSFLPIFFIGNLFQFTPEMAANHKFFNFFLILGNIFSAYAVYLFWQKKIFGKLIAILSIFFLIFSGIIDFFPVKNDHLYSISDAPQNPDIAWIKNQTPSSAVFLNSTYLYHPASLAGRKIFLGWPYFPWAGGYDAGSRGRLLRKLYQETDLAKLCRGLEENGIDYITTTRQTVPDPDSPEISPIFEEKFVKLYSNPQTSFAIYGRKETCQ